MNMDEVIVKFYNYNGNNYEGEVELSYSYIPEALVEMKDETLTNPGNDEFIINLDNEYFEDDMVGRFVEFVKIVWYYLCC